MNTMLQSALQPPDRGLDAATERAIARRAEELAIQGFHDRDTVALDWLTDMNVLPELGLLAIAAHSMPHSVAQEMLDKAVERYREKYIKDCRDLYRQQAADYILEGTEA